jgi:basic membrane lipoprotein Med (substrate-binding protein (PBP1-ABC) superfamily)
VALSSQYTGSGLNVWFKDDIKNTLSAIDSANAELFKAIDTPEMRLYRQGYEAAIRAIAEAFGMKYESTTRRREESPAIIDVTPC